MQSFQNFLAGDSGPRVKSGTRVKLPPLSEADKLFIKITDKNFKHFIYLLNKLITRFRKTSDREEFSNEIYNIIKLQYGLQQAELDRALREEDRLEIKQNVVRFIQELGDRIQAKMKDPSHLSHSPEMIAKFSKLRQLLGEYRTTEDLREEQRLYVPLKNLSKELIKLQTNPEQYDLHFQKLVNIHKLAKERFKNPSSIPKSEILRLFKALFAELYRSLPRNLENLTEEIDKAFCAYHPPKKLSHFTGPLNLDEESVPILSTLGTMSSTAQSILATGYSSVSSLSSMALEMVETQRSAFAASQVRSKLRPLQQNLTRLNQLIVEKIHTLEIQQDLLRRNAAILRTLDECMKSENPDPAVAAQIENQYKDFIARFENEYRYHKKLAKMQELRRNIDRLESNYFKKQYIEEYEQILQELTLFYHGNPHQKKHVNPILRQAVRLKEQVLRDLKVDQEYRRKLREEREIIELHERLQGPFVPLARPVIISDPRPYDVRLAELQAELSALPPEAGAPPRQLEESLPARRSAREGRPFIPSWRTLLKFAIYGATIIVSSVCAFLLLKSALICASILVVGATPVTAYYGYLHYSKKPANSPIPVEPTQPPRHAVAPRSTASAKQRKAPVEELARARQATDPESLPSVRASSCCLLWQKSASIFSRRNERELDYRESHSPKQGA